MADPGESPVFVHHPDRTHRWTDDRIDGHLDALDRTGQPTAYLFECRSLVGAGHGGARTGHQPGYQNPY